LQIEEHTQKSNKLSVRSDENKEKATDLAKRGMEKAAKRRLALYLLCNQFLEKEESIIADLDTAKLQLEMQTENPESNTLLEVNKRLQESVAEGIKASQQFDRMTSIITAGADQRITEVEGYGVAQKSIDEEFRKLLGEDEPSQKQGYPNVATSDLKAKQEFKAKQSERST